MGPFQWFGANCQVMNRREQFDYQFSCLPCANLVKRFLIKLVSFSIQTFNCCLDCILRFALMLIITAINAVDLLHLKRAGRIRKMNNAISFMDIGKNRFEAHWIENAEMLLHCLKLCIYYLHFTKWKTIETVAVTVSPHWSLWQQMALDHMQFSWHIFAKGCAFCLFMMRLTTLWLVLILCL